MPLSICLPSKQAMRHYRSYAACKRAGLYALSFLFVVGLCSCATTSLPPIGTLPELSPQQDIVLQVGDELDVEFLFWPELNTQRLGADGRILGSQSVRSDGKISLQLVGDVQAAGLTPMQFKNALEQRYSGILKDPEITVVVRKQVDRFVYVGGEVQAPGAFSMPGRLTALEAVMQAGGAKNRSARMSNVIIVRHRDGRRYACGIDLRHALREAESQPFLLEPYDIVFVPRTRIDQVGQWVDQYINALIPDKFVYSDFERSASATKANARTLQLNLRP